MKYPVDCSVTICGNIVEAERVSPFEIRVYDNDLAECMEVPVSKQRRFAGFNLWLGGNQYQWNTVISNPEKGYVSFMSDWMISPQQIEEWFRLLVSGVEVTNRQINWQLLESKFD